MSKIILLSRNAEKLINAINQVSPATAIEEILISLKIAQDENCFSIDGLIERLKQQAPAREAGRGNPSTC